MYRKNLKNQNCNRTLRYTQGDSLLCHSKRCRRISKIAIRFFVTNVPQNDRKNSYHSKCITRILKIKIATGPFATLRVTAFYVILNAVKNLNETRPCTQGDRQYSFISNTVFFRCGVYKHLGLNQLPNTDKIGKCLLH